MCPSIHVYCATLLSIIQVILKNVLSKFSSPNTMIGVILGVMHQTAAHAFLSAQDLLNETPWDSGMRERREKMGWSWRKQKRWCGGIERKGERERGKEGGSEAGRQWGREGGREGDVCTLHTTQVYTWVVLKCCHLKVYTIKVTQCIHQCFAPSAAYTFPTNCAVYYLITAVLWCSGENSSRCNHNTELSSASVNLWTH